MTRVRMTGLTAALVAIFALSPAAGQVTGAQAVTPQATPAQVVSHAPVITHHTGTFNGNQVRYAVTVEPLDVPDTKGKPAARLVSFAYTADNVKDAATRPVMFVFNGGPITASLWLHVGVMGPKRVAVPDNLMADPN